MSELGNYLKETREDKQITLDDLQRTTKIQKRYLAAIEEGNFDTLPGIFYARAFVKTYAEAIGLDADEVLETYKNELPNPQTEAVDLPSRSERVKTSARTAPSRPGKGRGKSLASILVPILLIAAVVLVIVLIWNVSGRDSGGEVQNEQEAGQTDTYDPPENAGDEEEGEGAADKDEAGEDEAADEESGSEDEQTDKEPELSLEETSGNVSTYILTNVEAIETLKIEMGEGSYVQVRDRDGQAIEENGGDYKDDFEPDVSGLDALELNIGNGYGVERVEVNGIEVELLETDHQYVTITVEEQE
ncbi:helix-turn-helix domain-containing protein [Shouchella clausii]|jgi:cytoskeletal protein RodZ|uniref:Cytoskeleton protein RodZ-like C-terminal domain-containing protein n=1 Tax=Shouchella clausii TaxID=79880 RepID=A0A268S6B0_SHOCL|nr:RodZ domain-containing protein [Shouchella clausii]PAD44693.1 hypothetical protein CHH54_01220 [Bacillus sp. 7520-S]AST97577.1 hypothetical protein BC8716_17065 [Shouchella clausii]MBU8594908.1 helix-turn-helix domain-containing protein [Shouchella clausii]MCM3550645.1 helix-turn-helix domain-containing protein [Shouchella clausii]MCR1286213.1 helix-turn-helix domain-containing protein [Shouchella clausii]